MSKILKTKNLPLFPILDRDQLRRENHLEDAKLTDFSAAWDGTVYLLMEQPSGKQEEWIGTSSLCTVVEIKLDWTEQRVLETTLFPIGFLKFQFHAAHGGCLGQL